MKTKRDTVSTADKAPPEVDYFARQLKRGKRGSSNSYVALLGMRDVETSSIIRQIENGLAFSAVEHLRRSMVITLNQLADLASINQRTLNRRKKEGKLEPDESDRIVRVGRIFGRSLELFEGDHRSARHWFMSPQKALGNKTPSDLAKTEFGALEVERVIGRLEHGVFT